MNIKKDRIGEYYIAELDEASLPQNDPWYAVDSLGIDAWCSQTFGSQDIWGEEPVSGWKRMRHKYFFTQESMLTMFMLRYS